MKIAIQAADLDYPRIDGTRVYIKNLLENFGKISSEDDFYIYHKNEFNPELVPPDFSNYHVKKLRFPLAWTQTRLALELWKDQPDVLWMPMHNAPIIKPPKTKLVVTVHDLAYKYFPKHFPFKDRFLLNWLGGRAIRQADKLIAVSESTKRDILKFYPSVRPEKIRVIYHGFDSGLFQNTGQNEDDKILKRYNLQAKSYILYSGAIQPRKNLKALLEAFNSLRKDSKGDIRLVIAGEKAWLWDEVLGLIENSPHKSDIVLTGKVPFSEMGALMRGAKIYVFPSLYEGFGLTVLEALSAGVPLVCAGNSSLPEVGGEAPLYFDANDPTELGKKMKLVLEDENLRSSMIAKGLEQVKKFSWEKCTQETLEWFKR